MNSNKLRMHQKALIVSSDELFAVLKEALPGTADSKTPCPVAVTILSVAKQYRNSHEDACVFG